MRGALSLRNRFEIQYSGLDMEAYKKWLKTRWDIELTPHVAELAKEYWEKFKLNYPDIDKWQSLDKN